MSQLGARFRETREARGLTLAEAASGTRILPRYLQAIEDGDFGQLPGDVYARGFIRNYAQFLELSPEELLHLYRRERGAPTDKIKVVPAAVPPRTRSCLVPSAFATFFAVLVLLGLFYLVAQASGLTRAQEEAVGPTPTAPPPTATTWATPTLQTEGSLPSRLPATPTMEAPPQPTPTIAPTLSAPLVVEVRIAPDAPRGSWLTVSADGRPSFTGTLLANGSKVIEAQREVFVHAGDASVVELVVNGVSQGRMGTVPGGVAKKTITPPASGSTP